VLPVQLLDPLLVDQLDREVAVRDACRLQRSLRRRAQARVVCLDVDQREARRSSGA
jgi:hypothetical protein